jgi:hypothetical protein
MPKAAWALAAMAWPMLPRPMTPRMWPRGLWETAVALRWQLVKVAAVEEAEMHQGRWRKVERMPKRVKSATDSVEAREELQ